MLERNDEPNSLEPPDRSTYRMPRLPMVRGLMWAGVLLFLAGGALMLIHVGLGDGLLWHVAMYLFSAGILLTAIGFFAETCVGALLKPEAGSGGDAGKPGEPKDGGS